MFERPPSTIGKEFKLLNLIFLSLCLKLWFIDLLVVKSISQIPWANFRQSRMPVHVSWPVLNRETLLNKSVTIYVGILSIAISSRIAVAPYQVSSSYYWPITSFTKNVCLQIYTGSSLGTICEVPRSCLKTFGDRSFVSAIPNLWNQLPLSVCLNNSLSSFKNGLKRYYFKQYYMCWSLSSS